MKKIRHFLTGLATAALVSSAWAAPTAISATLETSHVALGDSAMLTVSLRGRQAAAPQVPRVDGLDIAPMGQSTTMQVINGAVSSSASYQYNVTPQRAGSFTIPAISAGGAVAQPIGFRVEPDAGSRANRPGRSSNHSRSPTPSELNDDGAVDAKGQPAFLRVTMPKQSLYVGELVPVQVKAYFRAGMSASLNGLPLLSSDAFSLAKLSDQPEQTEEMIDGQPFTVLAWDSTLSAVKAGSYPLNLDLPVTVRVREKGRRGGHNPLKDFFGDDSSFGSMFDDSIFDNFFGNVTEKPLTLHTNGATVKIETPPAAGRPADFSGAVGDFDLTAQATATNASAGDPLSLVIKVSGQGNFDRVNLAGLSKSAAWKAYKPSAKFEPGDGAGHSGTKTFEQAIIPEQVGAQEIPALSFSYFDPVAAKYVTRHTPPIAVQVAPADPSKVSASAPIVSDSESSAPAAPEPIAEGIHASPIASLHPLILRPWFILWNAALLAALGIVPLTRWIQARRARDPRRLAQEAAEKSLAESLVQMDDAVQHADGPRFFEAARQAVRKRLAEQWHLPPGEITPAAISQRLNGHGEDLRSIFRTADEAAYCGRRFNPGELRQWHDTVTQQLQHIAEL